MKQKHLCLIPLLALVSCTEPPQDEQETLNTRGVTISDSTNNDAVLSISISEADTTWLMQDTIRL